MIRAALCLLLIGTAAAAVTVDVGAAAVGNEWRPASCDAVKDGVVLTNVAANVRAVIEGCTIAVSSSTAAVVSAVAIDGLGAGASVELRGCTITAAFTHLSPSTSPTDVHAAVRVLPGAALGAGSALVIDGTSIETQDRTNGIVGAAVLLDTAVVAGDGFALAVKGGSKLRSECTRALPCAGVAVTGQIYGSPTGRVVFGARTAITVEGSTVHAVGQGIQGRGVWFVGVSFGQHSVVAISNSGLGGATGAFEGTVPVSATLSGLEVKNTEFGANARVSVAASNVTAMAPDAASGIYFSNVGFGDDAVVMLDDCNVTSTTTTESENSAPWRKSFGFVLVSGVHFGLRANVSVFDTIMNITAVATDATALWFGSEVTSGELAFGNDAVIALKGTRISASLAPGSWQGPDARGLLVAKTTFGDRCSVSVTECTVSIASTSSASAGVSVSDTTFGDTGQFHVTHTVVAITPRQPLPARGLAFTSVGFGPESNVSVAGSNVSAPKTVALAMFSLGARSAFLVTRSNFAAFPVGQSTPVAVDLFRCQFLETALTFQDSTISAVGRSVNGFVITVPEIGAGVAVKRCNITASATEGVATAVYTGYGRHVVSITGSNIVVTAPRAASALDYRGWSTTQLVLEDTNVTAIATATSIARALLCYDCEFAARSLLRITRCNMTSITATDDAVVLEIFGDHRSTFGEHSVVTLENATLTAKAGGDAAAAVRIWEDVMTKGNGTVRIVGSTLSSSALTGARAIRFQESDLVNTSIVVVGSVLQFEASGSTGAPNGAIVSDASSTWDGVSLALTDTALAAGDATTAAAKASFIVWPKTVAGVSPQRLTNVSLAAPEAAGVAVFAVLAGGAGPGPNATLCLRDVAWGRSGYGVRAGPAAFAVADECVVTPTSTATAAATGTAPLSFTLSRPPTPTNALTATIGATVSSERSVSASVPPTVSALRTVSVEPSASRRVTASRTSLGTLTAKHSRSQTSPRTRTNSFSPSHSPTPTVSRSVLPQKVGPPDTSGLSTAETALLATGLTAFAGVSVMAALLLLWRYRHLLPGSDSGAGPATELEEVKAVQEREDGEQCIQGSSDDEGFFQTGPNPLS